MHAPAGLRDAHELGEHAFHVRHRLDHVAVGDEIEGVVGLREVERVAGLESQPRRERRMFVAGVFHGRGQQLDAEHLRFREHAAATRALNSPVPAPTSSTRALRGRR